MESKYSDEYMDESVELTEEQINENLDFLMESLEEFDVVNEGKMSKELKRFNELDKKLYKTELSEAEIDEYNKLNSELFKNEAKNGNRSPKGIETVVRNIKAEFSNKHNETVDVDGTTLTIDVDIYRKEKWGDKKILKRFEDIMKRMYSDYSEFIKSSVSGSELKIEVSALNESYIITESLEVNEGKIISINKLNGKKIKNSLAEAKKLWDVANKHKDSKQYSAGYAGYTMDEKDQKDSDAKFAKFDKVIAELSKVIGEPISTIEEMSWDDEFRKRVFKGKGINESLEVVESVNESKTDLEIVNEAFADCLDDYNEHIINEGLTRADEIKKDIKGKSEDERIEMVKGDKIAKMIWSGSKSTAKDSDGMVSAFSTLYKLKSSQIVDIFNDMK